MATIFRSTEDDSRVSPHKQNSRHSQTCREIQILRDLSDAELDELVTSSKLYHVERHHVVYCAGERLSELYVVQRGSFKLIRHSEEGKELNVALVGAAKCFGAYAEPADSPTLAQALEPSAYLAIPTTIIRRTIAGNPNFAVRLLAQALDRHREAETAAARLAFETVPVRLTHLLLDSSDPRSGAMSFPLNQTEIANLIGSSRETVCSILNQFRRRGWLEIERGRIRVVDRTGLSSVH